MSGRKAIVTLAIGEEFAARWREACEENWRAYADRHGYDLICITDPPDDSRRARDRSPSWQKLLLLGQPWSADYERIVWVDSDCAFGPAAPDISEGVPLEKVGAVDELELPTPAIRELVHPRPMEVYYGEFGLPGSFEHIVQAGVMVTSPAHHREVFEHVYDAYEDIPGMFYEMRPLSYELLDRDLVHWLDPRFNTLWTTWKAWRYPFLLSYTSHPKARAATRHALDEVHVLHFAGQAKEMPHALAAPRPPRPPRPLEEPARSPVVLFWFARPDTSERVLEAVRAARPGRLLVVANAPRPGVEGEAELCERTRALLDRVDWDCEVVTDFADEHLSQTDRIESGIDRAFELWDEAIFLEDDCLPDPTFFRYCDELLERHRDDPRVMSVAGTNFQFGDVEIGDSYYWSRYFMTWGWAGWRRAWERHDREMAEWPALRDAGWLRENLGDPNAVAYWSWIFEQTHRDRDAWDYAWLYTGLRTGGVHAIPSVNLVSNLGFREDATHTMPAQGTTYGELPVEEMAFPLRHPASLATNRAADAHVDRFMFGGRVSEMFNRLRTLRTVEQEAAR